MWVRSGNFGNSYILYWPDAFFMLNEQCQSSSKQFAHIHRVQIKKVPLVFYRATAGNATHGIAAAILSVCPSVCLYCDKTKGCTANILTPHETTITLVLWHQQWLVGDALFPVKYSPKVTDPCAKLIVPCNQYFTCIRQMAFRSCYSCPA